MFVTFYSYKGGVGRTSALANIACLLAQDELHPQKVLLWDFDLEAPGLHNLFPPKTAGISGFVNLVHDFVKTGSLPAIKNYIYQTEMQHIDLLPAGQIADSYSEKLQEIYWPALFSEDQSDASPFFSEIRKQIIELKYDYIFIDSRTGLNDQAGICTQILPDLLVVLFRMSDQDLEGLSHVVPAIHSQLANRGRNDVEILPVASTVIPDGSEKATARRDRFSQIFGARELDFIRFDAELLGDERLYFIPFQRSAIWPPPVVMEDYDRVSASIRGRNEDDTRTGYTRLRRYLNRNDFASAFPLLIPLIKRRPRLNGLWNMLSDFKDSTQRDAIDSAVDSILLTDPKNAYCYEWKAGRLLEGAISPGSDKITLAKDLLSKAANLFTDRSLYRTLAQVCSVQGDLDAATDAMRFALKNAQNSQVRIDLADILIRRGSAYFAVALEELKAVESNISIRVFREALVNSFLTSKAELELVKAFAAEVRGNRVSILEAHILLNCNDRESADSIVQKLGHPANSNDLCNLIEYYICALRFKDAIAVASNVADEAYIRVANALKLLAIFLEANDASEADVIEVSDLVEAWSKVESWNFNELVMLRERARRDRLPIAEKLEILEELIRYSEFNSLANIGRKRRLRTRVAVDPVKRANFLAKPVS